MKIQEVRVKSRSVSISYENEGSDYSITSKDVPLPAFYKAIEALRGTILGILHLPAEYVEGLKPIGLTVADKQEVQLVCLVAQKSLPECHSPFNIATPLRFMEHPKEEGSYSPALEGADLEVISEVIEQAKAYVRGDRAQGQLPLGDAPEHPEEVAGDPIPGEALPFPTEEPKKGRKRKGA